MKQIILFILISIVYYGSSIAQDVHFSDSELERYLIQEKCVDIDGDGNGDITADLNKDSLLQLDEILSIKVLDVTTSYAISDVSDLNLFTNLDSLYLWVPSSTQHITISIDSLLFINASDFTKHSLDLSGSLNLKSIYLEGCTLKYLNIKNGSFASSAFSMFYSRVDSLFCVDPIPSEYYSSYVGPNGRITTDCSPFLGVREQKSFKVSIYPNPVNDKLTIVSNNYDAMTYRIFNRLGQEVRYDDLTQDEVNIEFLPHGVYFIELKVEGEKTMKKFVKL